MVETAAGSRTLIHFEFVEVSGNELVEYMWFEGCMEVNVLT